LSCALIKIREIIAGEKTGELRPILNWRKKAKFQPMHPIDLNRVLNLHFCAQATFNAI
jgi:hypothetical protein